MESQRKVRIVNSSGLHARPCHAIVSAAMSFQSTLRVRCAERDVNGKSILELMTLEACCGSDVVLVAEGDDGADLLDRLEALFGAGFDESL